MNGKHPQLKDLLGNYYRTKNNQSINHWINEKTKVINKNEYNAGIWKDVETNRWCIGYLDINVDDTDDCKYHAGNTEDFSCSCIFRNPSNANCPHEKMMLPWEYLNKYWLKLNSEDLEINPRQGNKNIISA